MSCLTINPISGDSNFGVRISGVTMQALQRDEIKSELRDLFDRHGLIVFEDTDASDDLQIELSKVFGPLKEHPIPTVPRAGIDGHPGIIKIEHKPEDPNIVQINGQELSQWLPWHFDHCYNDKLNRAGVLRAISIAPEGGKTGFLDGVELYNAISPSLRKTLEELSLIYVLDPLFGKYRFGLPKDFRLVRVQQVRIDTAEYVKNNPRAIHPAVWTRSSGERVLHMTPFMAMGIEGDETPDGDRMFEEVCDEIFREASPYFHTWREADMLIWDNWRMLHCSTGIDPKYRRQMHRTTIEGDYGLGRFEA